MNVELILFTKEHIKKTFEFIQYPNVSKYFARKSDLSWEKHVAYWEQSLNDPTQKSYAVLCDG